MSAGPFDADCFAAMPLIAILRGQSVQAVEPVVHSLFAGGIRFMEITMNSPDAIDQIRSATEKADARMSIGAGTVTTLPELDAAHDAGARFIVTPVVVPTVILECVRRGLPVFPGAFTPTEVYHAHQLGATMVKLFPAHRVGPGYIRDLKAPLGNVRLLATGGITPDLLSDYIAAGADGFGIGSPLLSRERLVAGEWGWLQCRAADFCAAWRAARSESGRE